MAEDLLNRIQLQLQERIEELRGAVQERDRLQAELGALQNDPAALQNDPPALEPDPQPVAALQDDPAALQDDRKSVASKIIRFPVRYEPARARRAVSPKVARLMLTPRRPSLERSGIPRVSARSEHADVSAEAPVAVSEARAW